MTVILLVSTKVDYPQSWPLLSDLLNLELYLKRLMSLDCLRQHSTFSALRPSFLQWLLTRP
jgi:hypothetical protein